MQHRLSLSGAALLPPHHAPTALPISLRTQPHNASTALPISLDLHHPCVSQPTAPHNATQPNTPPHLTNNCASHLLRPVSPRVSHTLYSTLCAPTSRKVHAAHNVHQLLQQCFALLQQLQGSFLLLPRRCIQFLLAGELKATGGTLFRRGCMEAACVPSVTL